MTSSTSLAPLPLPTPESRVRVLVVDDDAFTCALHATTLEREGYDVVTSDNGADALTQLAGGDFDLVLTDRHMPCLDGASMVLTLRRAGSQIPVVMVSGSLAHTPLPRAVAREVSAALPKPARISEILGAVRGALVPRPGLLAPTL